MAKNSYETATFAAGCFWGIQQAFDQVPGVIQTRVGYMGGHVNNPTEEEVYTDKTNHAETCEIIFDPKRVSYEKLLEVFWMIHDPTLRNRQGLNFGTRYRSVIFYQNLRQKTAAEKSREVEQKKRIIKKIATEILPATDFYLAESYHQKFYESHNVACHITLPQFK